MKQILNTIGVYWELFRQFGSRYSAFRVKYELSKKLGFYKSKFPTHFDVKQYLTLESWRISNSNTFIFNSREEIAPQLLRASPVLSAQVKRIEDGEINFFYKEWKKIGFLNESLIHPETGYKYPMVHWTEIPIYDVKIGDIKYVWEKSKFSYLLYLVRNDLHNAEDHSLFAFAEIDRWITENPPNIGPQYICSQEMSIRLMNWSFVLFFYKNSPNLTQDLLNRIMTSINLQLEHIYRNINFSRIAVRNNHAVTETLALYLISVFFPCLKDAQLYKKSGKKWFEEEIAFQLFEDGSDSQYSFNYHRVKIQLLTWALSVAKVNGEKFNNIVYKRAESSLNFLYDKIGNYSYGQLPNFGANDGSIYFKFNDEEYDNFLPQLNALASLLNIEIPNLDEQSSVKEDEFWFTQKIKIENHKKKPIQVLKGITQFTEGGYVRIRENNENLTLFKTPNLLFRAAQDDVFHIDIWVNGQNYLRDSGSYLYNTDEKTKMFFNGLAGHNSVAAEGIEHMLKGPRFTWLYKPKHIGTTISETDSHFSIISKMEVYHPFKYTLERRIKKEKNISKWIIEDEMLETTASQQLLQHWNINPLCQSRIKFSALDRNGNVIDGQLSIGYFSKNYGVKEESLNQSFKSDNGYIKTVIEIDEASDS